MTLSGLNPWENLHKLLQQRWVVWPVNALLVVWLAWMIGTVIRDYLQPPPETVAIRPSVAVATKSHQTITASQVAGWHLFGETTADVSKQGQVVKAPDTRLNLTLRGIYFPDDQGESIAIIQNAGKDERHFTIRQSVFKLATLEQIHIDRVIILHNGKHETLRLPKKSLDLEFMEDSRVVASKTIQEFRNDLLTGNMGIYVYHVDYDTVWDEIGFAGFKIIGANEEGKEILRKIGLEDGDLVTEIDGIDLANDPNMINALRNLRTAKMVNLSIKRTDILQHITLDFTQQ
jgi:general secretion pathway protein C